MFSQISDSDDIKNEFHNVLSDIKNSDIEILTDYFDIIPESTLFTDDLMPIFTVRFKTNGLLELVDFYSKKYDINLNVFGYICDSKKHNMCFREVSMLFTKESGILKHCNFCNLKDTSSYKGVIINLVNKDHRLMHAMPMIFGRDKDGQKIIIMLDRFFNSFGYPDGDSSYVLRSARLFKEVYGDDVIVYCHDHLIQVDMHSCTIFAIDLLKCALRTKKMIKEIINNSSDVEIKYSDGNEIIIKKYNIPDQMLCLVQKNSEDFDVSKYKTNKDKNDFEMFYKDLKSKEKIFFVNTAFEKSNGYDENHKILPIENHEYFIMKKINTNLIIKAHKYAFILMQILKRKNLKIIDYRNKLEIKYSPKYWINILENKIKLPSLIIK